MSGQQIFGLQVVLTFVVYGLAARWYLSPRLATLPLGAALQPLLVLHALRHVGMVFLVPTVVGPALPASFAVPAAYGVTSWPGSSRWPRWARSARDRASRFP
jgi:hypothetical protein